MDTYRAAVKSFKQVLQRKKLPEPALPSSLYSPLDPSEPSFRLLLLLPRSDNQSHQVQCELINVPLIDPRQYVACSYVWGPLEPTSAIIVNRHEFFVRQNLAEMLCARRRKRGRPVVLWVDAICINQQDLAERSSQVAMMDRIFRSAEAVHCWLGASPSLATSLAQVGKKSNRGSNEQEFEAVLRKKDDAMGVLARCEYWTRMWIVQEFLLARSIILVAGPVQIPFQLMDVTIAELANAEHRQWENVEAGIAARILQLRRMRNDRFGRDFEGLFEAFNSMRCAVPRDRMFSLLGILQPKEAKMLRRLVDYEADIWHVRNRILESGLVRDYLWFMQHFAISVALSEPDPTTTEQVSLPFYPCLQTVEHAVHDDSGTRRPPFEGPWHFHSCLPCHRGRWLQDMYIPCRWLQYMSCSYDLIRISGAWHSNFQLHGCALIPLCGADCRRECQGHAIAGVALILEDYSPLDQNPIEPVFGWAQTLVRGPAAYDSNWDFAFADIRHATTVADALEPATSSITVVRVSKSKYSTMHMRTSAKAFVQLCDFFSKLDRSYRLEPRPLLPPRSAVSPAASAEMIIGAYIPSPGAGGSLFRP